MSKYQKFDYSKEPKENRTYNILRPLGKLICRLLFKVKYVGIENIPQEGGMILASNHIYLVDPLFIAMGIKKRQLFFMAKKELWNNPIVAWAFTKVNDFPIAQTQPRSDTPRRFPRTDLSSAYSPRAHGQKTDR